MSTDAPQSGISLKETYTIPHGDKNMFSKNTRPTRSMYNLIPVLSIVIAAAAWQAGAKNASRPPAQPTVVVTVDIVEVIDQLEERKVRESQLDANKSARQDQLNEVLDQLKVIQTDLEVLNRNTDEYKDKVRQAMEMQAVVKARGEALNQILSLDRGNVTREMYQKITNAITRISDREGYDIVLFDDSLFPVAENVPFSDVYRSIISRSVIYRHESVDITGQVVTLLNNEFTAP